MLKRSDFYTLMDRVKRDPSVLFLGQDYLKSISGRNLFHEALYERIQNRPIPSDPVYSDLWELSDADWRDDGGFFEALRAAASSIPKQPLLGKILSMRWNMLYTSAINSFREPAGTITAFKPISPSDRFRGEFMSKQILNTVYLYGSVDGGISGEIPENADLRGLMEAERKVSDKLPWIFNDILKGYGVLVVDGWNPKRDWLKTLLVNAINMPESSIFLFSAEDDIAGEDQRMQILIDEGVIICESRSLAEVINEYEYFAEDEDMHISTRAGRGYKTVSIYKYEVNIPDEALSVFDSNILLLHDDVGADTRGYDEDEKGKAYLEFMKQDNMPIWPLYNRRFGFYFPRDAESDLRAKIKEELRKRPIDREPIYLEGASNTGKTAVLAHLALDLRNKRIDPVFFINGRIPELGRFTNDLKKFIKYHLTDPPERRNGIAKNIIIIWDDSKNTGRIKACKALQDALEECNVIVVGSKYLSSPGKNSVKLKAELEPHENDAFKQVLSHVDPALLDLYESISKKSCYLFHTLTKLASFSYDPQWIAFRESLRDKARTEMNTIKEEQPESIDEILDRYDIYGEQIQNQYEEVSNSVIKQGIGSNWKLQLEELKDKLKMVEELSGGEVDLSEIQRKVKIREETAKNLDHATRLLALAGQFDIELPLSLILRIVFKNIHVRKSNERMLVEEIIRMDGLLRRSVDKGGYLKVAFRHFSEAEVYIKMHLQPKDLVPDEAINRRKRQEVKLLCEFIDDVDWNDFREAMDIIALIRRFGPNSYGKATEIYAREGMLYSRREDYEEYKDYWVIIAEHLYRRTDVPEAVLVYSHFMRKSGANLVELENVLTDTLNYLGRDDRQRERILGELCANLEAQMESGFKISIFKRFKGYFKELIFSEEDQRVNGIDGDSTNLRLNIWLSAINHYYSFIADNALENEAFIDELSLSMNFIDRLFDYADDEIPYRLLTNIQKIDVWFRTLLNSNNQHMEVIINKLKTNGNDSYLYMLARSYWRKDTSPPKKSEDDTREAIAVKWAEWDLYSLPDDADKNRGFEKIEQYRIEAISYAKKTIELFNDKANRNLIRKSSSARCLEMLIKSKWLLYSGTLLLEEEQMPGKKIDELLNTGKLCQDDEISSLIEDGWLGYVSFKRWNEMYNHCIEYLNYCQKKDYIPKISILFLKAVYEWLYEADRKKVKDIFAVIRSRMNKGWMIDRFILCSEGSCVPRIFNPVKTTIENDRSITATIKFELDKPERYRIFIDKETLRYLFGTAAETETTINKDVWLRFSARGANICQPRYNARMGGEHTHGKQREDV